MVYITDSANKVEWRLSEYLRTTEAIVHDRFSCIEINVDQSAFRYTDEILQSTPTRANWPNRIGGERFDIYSDVLVIYEQLFYGTTCILMQWRSYHRGVVVCINM